MQSTAIFETDGAHRYLEVLCQHFGRKVKTHQATGVGSIQFSFGRCDMTANTQQLEMIASAADESSLDTVIDVMTRHLERYAFRENPRLGWKHDLPPSADR